MKEYFNDLKYVDGRGKTYDFTGWYKMSNTGRVISVVDGTEMFVTNNQKQPYIIMTLRRGGYKRKSFYYHRALVSSFPEIYGELKAGLEVNHKDENTHNNSPDNLEIVDKVTNCNWGTRNKRIAEHQKNTHCPKPIAQYDLKGNLVKDDWDSAREIERTTGYFHQNIIGCCKGRYKTMYGYIWKYA